MFVRCAGQLRIAPSGAVVGLDLPAALLLARALGYDERAVAELLPACEAGMVRTLSRVENG